jgi:hypothetical protein
MSLPLAVLSDKSSKVLRIPRSGGRGFGFTLRHFIIYPPEVSALATSPFFNLHPIPKGQLYD